MEWSKMHWTKIMENMELVVILSELSTTTSFQIDFSQTLMSMWSVSVETMPWGINNLGGEEGMMNDS